MTSHVEEEITALRERADKAEAELAALRDHGSMPAVEQAVDDQTTAPEAVGGEDELLKDSMMAHLMESLQAGRDIGHYGRLVFAIVARHFLPDEEVLAWLTLDLDFSETKARVMLSQVEDRGYNPPKRDRILQWQKEQEFPIMPHPDDPDCGNLYRTLKFPDDVYQHIEEYQEQRQEARS